MRGQDFLADHQQGFLLILLQALPLIRRLRTIIGSDNGLVPGRCQAIIWTNDWAPVEKFHRHPILKWVAMIWTKWDGACLRKSTWLTECSALFCYYYYNYSSLWPSDAIWCQWCQSALGQVMAWCLFGTKPLPEPMMTYCQQEPREHFLWHLSQWMKLF